MLWEPMLWEPVRWEPLLWEPSPEGDTANRDRLLEKAPTNWQGPTDEENV